MNGKQRLEVSKMLKLLKKEENFYEKTIQNVKKELMRLEIEGLSLKATIRQEEMQRQQLNEEETSSPAPDSVNKDENPIPYRDSSSPENEKESSPKLLEKPQLEQDVVSSSLQENEHSYNTASVKSSSVAESVMSSINDDRYLEPLFLDPNNFGDDSFVEFDD